MNNNNNNKKKKKEKEKKGGGENGEKTWSDCYNNNVTSLFIYIINLFDGLFLSNRSIIVVFSISSNSVVFPLL